MKVLILYGQNGCESCIEAKPHFEDFREQTRREIISIYADVSRQQMFSFTNYNPRVTPSYELMDEQRKPLKRFEGVLNLEQLREFVFGNLGKKVKK